MRPIEEASYWLATRPPQSSEELTGKLEADVAIIGAGFTGLWTAHFLRQLDPKLNVVVLEQGVAGYGGSGRNAGMISVCLDHSHELAAAHFGQKEADQLAKIGLQNIEELAAFAGDECDLERTGQLHVALTPSQVEACRAERVARRAARGADPSDAGPELVGVSRADFEPPEEWPSEDRAQIHTDHDWAESVFAVARLLMKA